MIQIQRHIEILLLAHDCVIVPGFGGFIAHQEDAHYDEDDRLWLPPFRTLGFNPQLTLNDSLLAQSYVEAYDMSYPDALRQIEGEVEELKGVLHTEGAYEMDGVGTLSINIEGNIEFEPCEAGILSPELYGLGDFGFKRLKDEGLRSKDEGLRAKDEGQRAKDEGRNSEFEINNEEEAPQPALLDFTDDEDDEQRALVVKMSWIRNAVAIAAAVACFFLLATPVANSDLGSKTMSQLQGNILYKLMPKDSNMTPAQPVEVNEVQKAKEEAKEEVQEVQEEAKEEVQEVKEDKEINAAEQKDSYCIVLASQVKRSNAEEYVEQLKKRGISDARIYVKNGVVRVVCGHFQNQAEAYGQLNKMSEEEEFAEAWTLKIKD